MSFTDVESQNSREESDSSDEDRDIIDDADSFSLIDNNIKTNKS